MPIAVHDPPLPIRAIAASARVLWPVRGLTLASALAQPKVRTLLSTEHFSVDGTLLEAWASPKSFRPEDGSWPPPDAGCDGEQDFRGQKCSNDTHASTTDPDAQLYRKGPGRKAKLCFMGHPVRRGRWR